MFCFSARGNCKGKRDLVLVPFPWCAPDSLLERKRKDFCSSEMLRKIPNVAAQMLPLASGGATAGLRCLWGAGWGFLALSLPHTVHCHPTPSKPALCSQATYERDSQGWPNPRAWRGASRSRQGHLGHLLRNQAPLTKNTPVGHREALSGPTRQVALR